MAALATCGAVRSGALRGAAAAATRARSGWADAVSEVSEEAEALHRRRRTRVRDAKQEERVGECVTLRGWARQVRAQKKVAFLEMNDGSAMAGIQVVAQQACDGFDLIREGNIAVGASVEALGELARSPGGEQSIELKANSISLLGRCDASEYPLQKKSHSVEFLRTLAHLRPRTNTIGAVTRIRSELSHSTHSFFRDSGFLQIHTPVITSLDCEGAGEQFFVTTLFNDTSGSNGSSPFDEDFFERPTYLTVSGQLNAEAFACSLGDVYTFGPAFRAENSNTSRHLSEFWMVEPEMAFATLDDAMDCCEQYVKYVVNAILTRCSDELEFQTSAYDSGLLDRLRDVATSEFVRLSYTDAIRELQAAYRDGTRDFEHIPDWGADLQTEHERFLSEERFRGRPVFVRDYPSQIKPFYMRENDSDQGETVGAIDLLLPEVGELVGGSQREERLDVLHRRMEQQGLDKSAYEWYLDLRRYGSVPHSGFGLGFERLVSYATGMNVRDVIAFPRHPGSAEY